MSIDASAVARVLGIDTVFKDLRGGNILYLPQRIAVIAQGSSAVSYATTKFQATSSGQVAARAGYGCPAHLAARELFPDNGDGVGTIPVTFYLLADDGSGVASIATITPSGSQTADGTYQVRIGGVYSKQFVITAGMTVANRCAAITAAINAVIEMPMIATNNTTAVGLTAKWKGASSNNIVVEVVVDALLGTVFAIVAPHNGAVNPSIAAALNQIGSVWESMVLNAMNADDTTTLDALQTFGEGRWNQLVRKPFVAFVGNTVSDEATATTVTSARTTDRINCQLVAPGSPNMPFVVAARQLARIAKLANNNPAHDYGHQRATDIIPGADSVQWDFATRDAAVKAGSSTSGVKDGVVNISDVVTMYRPTGEAVPAYRFVVDIVKLQQVLFNIDLLFANDEWDGAPLIPDNQATENPTAKKPKMAVAAVSAMLDSLGLQAIISDPATAKKNTFANINDSNPKRLDVSTQIQLSGNTNQKSVTVNWGFLFGSAAAAA